MLAEILRTRIWLKAPIQRASTDLTNGGVPGAEDKEPKYHITTPSSTPSAGYSKRYISASAGAEASVGQSLDLSNPYSSL